MLNERNLSLIAKHLEGLPEELWVNLDGSWVNIPALEDVSEGEHDDEYLEHTDDLPEDEV